MEDVQQVLRLKVWRALVAFDPARARGMNRDRYVFMCLRDQAKDLANKRKRRELYIEDLTDDYLGDERLSSRDRFDARYLSTTHDENFGAVEDDDLLIPNTLTAAEVEIVVLLYREYKQSEVARRLGLEKREMERAMRSIRQKLADWRPAPPAVVAPEPERQAA